MSETYVERPEPSTLAARVLRELLDAGMTGETLVATFDRTMSAINASEGARVALHRAAAAQRQRKSRASRGVSHETVTSVTVTDKEKPIKTKASSVTVGTVCPADWQPKDIHQAIANQLGFSKVWMFEQAERMRSWSVANANRAIARKSNWDQAFNNWMKDKGSYRHDNGHGSAPNGNGHASSVGHAAKQIADAAERGEFAIKPRPVLGETSGLPVRTIPER